MIHRQTAPLVELENAHPFHEPRIGPTSPGQSFVSPHGREARCKAEQGVGPFCQPLDKPLFGFTADGFMIVQNLRF
jgi:hypothetical protein